MSPVHGIGLYVGLERNSTQSLDEIVEKICLDIFRLYYIIKFVLILFQHLLFSEIRGIKGKLSSYKDMINTDKVNIYY
jgi:hypothetical protein